MAYAFPGDGSLDYYACRYGQPRLMFRGPRRDLGQPFVAALGGIETNGRYVAQPFPALLEARLGLPVVNFGCPNAGPDAWLADPSLLDCAARARLTVVQVTGAAMVSNRFYSVHPRRNDRFLHASPLLRSMFRTVDFTEISFTRHLLQALHAAAPDAFDVLAAELRAVWVARMVAVIRRLRGQVVLLWLADTPPPAEGGAGPGAEPALVDQAALAALRPLVAGCVEVVASPAARAQGLGGMVYPPLSEPAARGLPNPAVHAEVAAALADVVKGVM